MPADLVVDPRTVPGAEYAARAILVLLGITLLAVLVAAGLKRGGASPGTLIRRWATWAVLAPLWWLAVFCGPLSVAVVVTIFAVVGLVEFARLTDLPDAHRRLLLGAALLSGVLSLFGSTALLAVIPIILLAGMLQPILFPDTRSAVRHLAFGALAFGYLPLLLGHAVLIVDDLIGGAGILFATGVAVAFSDIGAYIIGRTFGRHPLAPAISPNKTVEGLAGNLIGAGVGYAIFLPVLPAMSAPLLVALPFLVALGAVWGDLFESALKREFGTKDAGTWLPGFGGLLDRIDSLILVVPLVYYLFRAAGLLKG